MKIKIVNRKKFIRSMMLILFILILTLLGIHNSYSKTEIAYKEEYIMKGDTLWSIAENQINCNEYYKNDDIRKVMYEIKKLNHIENENLEIGQKILIPNL